MDWPKLVWEKFDKPRVMYIVMQPDPLLVLGQGCVERLEVVAEDAIRFWQKGNPRVAVHPWKIVDGRQIIFESELDAYNALIRYLEEDRLAYNKRVDAANQEHMRQREEVCGDVQPVDR